MYLRGIVVFLAGLYLYVYLCARGITADMFVFWDPTTLFAFAVIISGTLAATGHVKTFVCAVNALFSKKYHLPAETRHEAVHLFKLLSKAVMAGTALLTMVGLILTLLNLSDPADMGERFSFALNAIFYGFLINIVFILPAIHILERRRNAAEKILINDKEVINKLLELCYKQGITPEEILEAGEVSFTNAEENYPN